jgi:hypothetical protein
MFPWLFVIKLVNTIWGMPTTLVVSTSNVELQLKFLPSKIPLDLLPNFVTYLINIPLLTTFMLGATTVSTPMVVICALSDWVILIPTCYFQVSTTVAFNTIGEVVLIQDRHYSNLWMWIPLQFFALGLNRWMNLLNMWSQLASHAFKSIFDYQNSWFMFMWLIH